MSTKRKFNQINSIAAQWPLIVELTLEDPQAVDRDLWTALHFVAAHPTAGAKAVISAMHELVSKDANVLADDVNGNSPLVFAILREDGNTDVADAFFEAAVRQSSDWIKDFAVDMDRLARVSNNPIRSYLLAKLQTLRTSAAPAHSSATQPAALAPA